MKTERNRLDRAFSKFIRLRDSDNGVCQCVTCHKFVDIKKIHCGHFMTRNCMSTRWDEKNCNAQCNGCNTFRDGRQWEHGEAIDKKYGPGTAEKLNIKSKLTKKWHKFELKEMIKYYEAEIKDYPT